MAAPSLSIRVRDSSQNALRMGGTLDFPSYCYRYAETGGFTQDGFRRAMQSQARFMQMSKPT